MAISQAINLVCEFLFQDACDISSQMGALRLTLLMQPQPSKLIYTMVLEA